MYDMLYELVGPWAELLAPPLILLLAGAGVYLFGPRVGQRPQ